MRFPFALTAKIAGHIIKQRINRTPKFALVLQLEPLHTCNLSCTGCGRIREYSTNLKDMMPLEDCLAAARECDAPMVSVCGGEPLIYPKIEELTSGLLEQGRIVHMCTNGMFMRKKMKDYLAAEYRPKMETVLARLKEEGLITEKDLETIRKGGSSGRPVMRPTRWMFWNVHIDGLEYTHDLIVEREGVFKECVEAIKMAKILGYQVATNTTVYKETEVKEIEQMFEFFSSLEVDAHTISPGYEYDAAKKDMMKRLGKRPEDFFDAGDDGGKIQGHGKMGRPVHDHRHAGVSGVSRGKARTDLHGVGDPDAECPRLEGAVLPDDRRALSELPANAGGGELGEIWRGGRRGAGCALRELHGALRVRSERGAEHQREGHLEEHVV
jgi:MoaA/NifB/PqqE/SkfB family radical SAM enzyme